MKKLKIFLWIFLLALAQISLVHYIEFGGIGPGLLFVFAVCMAMNEQDWNTKVIVAAICGAVADVCSSRAFGVNLVLYTGTALLAAGVASTVYRKNFWMELPLLFVLTVAMEAVYYLINRQALGYSSFLQAFGSVMLPAACYNAVMLLWMYPCMRMLWKGGRRYG